jgi:hypothetical protein
MHHCGRLLSLIDDTHPAAAELFQDAVVPNGAAYHARKPSLRRILGHFCSQVNEASVRTGEQGVDECENAFTERRARQPTQSPHFDVWILLVSSYPF